MNQYLEICSEKSSKKLYMEITFHGEIHGILSFNRLKRNLPLEVRHSLRIRVGKPLLTNSCNVLELYCIRLTSGGSMLVGRIQNFCKSVFVQAI